MKELNSDFTNAKVGDKVWFLSNSGIKKGFIINLFDKEKYPIRVKFNSDELSFTSNGRFLSEHAKPALFTHPVAIIHADDLENIGGFKERVMEVSDNEETWIKRVVFHQGNDFVVAWNVVETIESSKEISHATRWKFAREINHRAEEIKEQIAALQNELETIENIK
jgi:hypothetical protein